MSPPERAAAARTRRTPSAGSFDRGAFVACLRSALARRRAIVDSGVVTAYRVLDGRGDGMAGMYIDRLGPAVVMNVHEDAKLPDASISAAAQATLELLGGRGVESVYVKRFVRDRSRLGGRAPEESYRATPRTGRPQPEVLEVREYGSRFEVRPYDGLSTGLFLDHRDHRRALAARGSRRVLNLFAYTCAFSVPLVAAGARVVNVDVSARYLEWGERNLVLNGLDPAHARFVRMDARDFVRYARRHADERFDLVIIDPPTFGAADRRRGVKPWKATEHLPALLRGVTEVLSTDGAVFVSSNARELASAGALARLVREAVGGEPRWLQLPDWPVDVREPARVAATLFAP